MPFGLIVLKLSWLPLLLFVEFTFKNRFFDVFNAFDADFGSSVGYQINTGVTKVFLVVFAFCEKVICRYLDIFCWVFWPLRRLNQLRGLIRPHTVFYYEMRKFKLFRDVNTLLKDVSILLKVQLLCLMNFVSLVWILCF